MHGKPIRAWAPLAAAACACACACATVASAAALPLKRLDGADAAPAGPAILLFWRADCGPCLLELQDLAALRAAARPLPVTPVGLQPAALLRPALARLGLRPDDSLRTDADAAAVLVRYGGAPPRLPLAAALDAAGGVCARRTGLLGRDRTRAWARACGVAHAAG